MKNNKNMWWIHVGSQGPFFWPRWQNSADEECELSEYVQYMTRMQPGNINVHHQAWDALLLQIGR